MRFSDFVVPRYSVPGSDPFPLENGAVYIYGTLEERSRASAGVIRGGGTLVHLKELGLSRAEIDATPSKIIDCNRKDSVVSFVETLDSDKVYLDITGLSHDIWAPILSQLISSRKSITATYMEPAQYAANSNAFGGTIYDLSERIDGIKPIPGFVNLSQQDDQDAPLIAFLGFEGARFGYILEHVQPAHDKIIPVIGVPGFRLSYPFSSYEGNLTWLRDTRSWRYARYIAAYCPFSVYRFLEDVTAQFNFVRIAPIGTKPHALGALLFAARYPSSVEIIYDNPRRKVSRTSGYGLRHVYEITNYLGV